MGRRIGEDGAGGRSALTRAMDRHADGDCSAFAEVHDLLAPRLLLFFQRRTRDRAHAEDLVQQTLLQMHCARQSFVRGSDVIPWAYAIGRRLQIDAHRRRLREAMFEPAEDGAELGDCPSSDAPPEEIAVTRELAILVEEELSRLPEPNRIAYELVREEGMSMAEAADVLGTSVAAVKQRAHRVYDALRAALGPDGVPASRRRRG